MFHVKTDVIYLQKVIFMKIPHFGGIPAQFIEIILSVSNLYYLKRRLL